MVKSYRDGYMKAVGKDPDQPRVNPNYFSRVISSTNTTTPANLKKRDRPLSEEDHDEEPPNKVARKNPVSASQAFQSKASTGSIESRPPHQVATPSASTDKPATKPVADVAISSTVVRGRGALNYASTTSVPTTSSPPRADKSSLPHNMPLEASAGKVTNGPTVPRGRGALNYAPSTTSQTTSSPIHPAKSSSSPVTPLEGSVNQLSTGPKVPRGRGALSYSSKPS